jgi:hypothetical protein
LFLRFCSFVLFLRFVPSFCSFILTFFKQNDLQEKHRSTTKQEKNNKKQKTTKKNNVFSFLFFVFFCLFCFFRCVFRCIFRCLQTNPWNPMHRNKEETMKLMLQVIFGCMFAVHFFVVAPLLAQRIIAANEMDKMDEMINERNERNEKNNRNKSEERDKMFSQPSLCSMYSCESSCEVSIFQNVSKPFGFQNNTVKNIPQTKKISKKSNKSIENELLVFIACAALYTPLAVL